MDENTRRLAQFLLSEKDTRPHWETDQRAMLMPLVMSGYNNSVAYGVPSFLGGHAWSTMGDIVKGNAVHPDEIAHSANDAAGAAMLGNMPMGAPRGAIRSGAARTTPETGIRAYHGSPHDFDRFDMSKIGTGEGAQAFGHGLYFAENEGVAKSYRDELAGMTVGGKPINWNDPTHVASYWLQEKGSPESAISYLQSIPGAESRSAKESVRLLGNPDALPPIKSGGAMYEVNIKADPNDFLDWDKPLSQQADAVKGRYLQALGALGNPNPQKVLDSSFASSGAGLENLLQAWSKYDRAKASSALRDAGIPGIRYLDRGSRGAGEGSRNYVVFDDKLIEILRKYGLAGILAGGYAMTGQEPQE